MQKSNKVSFETARDKFIGRGNTVNNPKVINQAGPLSGSSGSVLDPIVSIQYRIFLDPYQSATIDMIFGIADTKELCNNLVEKYQDRNLTNRGLELAWTHSQVILRQINAVEAMHNCIISWPAPLSMPILLCVPIRQLL